MIERFEIHLQLKYFCYGPSGQDSKFWTCCAPLLVAKSAREIRSCSKTVSSPACAARNMLRIVNMKLAESGLKSPAFARSPRVEVATVPYRTKSVRQKPIVETKTTSAMAQKIRRCKFLSACRSWAIIPSRHDATYRSIRARGPF